jgi:serine protease Do
VDLLTEAAWLPKETSSMPQTTWNAPRVSLFVIALITAGTDASAQYSRKTPIVEAVQKTRAGIVTIKVHRPGGRKDVLGAGVIVDERGYIVTNRHVIVAAETINVRLSDGTELVGKLAAEIDTHDLAVIRIQTDKKPQSLALGPARDLMVGETVIAIGNPYGYANSVSTGIISALDREVTMPAGETIGNLIQTDASINPGNSGGPLLNINGEVIGITVALRDGAQGIAFALNADTVQQLLSKNLSASKISGVQHGLTFKGINSADTGDLRGVVVAEQVAQFRSGDEIVRIADRKIANRFDLERALWQYKPADSVSVTVRRGGNEHALSLKLGRSEKDQVFTLQPTRMQERATKTQPAGR